MSKVYYISHTNVDPDLNNKDIASWDLSPLGRERAEKGSKQTWIKDIKTVYSSNEQKAKTTADILFKDTALKIHHLQDLGETDRSSTGPLPREEHDALARQFFEHPNESARGWEKAIEAQQRTIDVIDQIISESSDNGDIAIVAHGGVGALYLCYLKKHPIDNSEAQPDMGSYFVFDSETKELLSDWQLIDEVNRTVIELTHS